MTDKKPSTPRCAALVGPYLAGKTTLLESLLAATGAIIRKGSVADGTAVGDGAPEARDRDMSTELSVATTRFLDEDWTFIDCPGSVELAQDTLHALMVADVAVVVCEPDAEKALMVAPLLKQLDDHNIPHIIFINKLDIPGRRVRPVFEALQTCSTRPLVLREIPLRDGDAITGYVDLVSERAFKWSENKPSELIQLPDPVKESEQFARTEMLESLADFDDTLLEELLEDIVPSREEIYQNLTKDLQHDLVVPVIFGSGESDHGVMRLLKLLRHETPDVTRTAARAGMSGSDPQATIFKIMHMGHAGKMSFGRVWSGAMKDGMTIGSERIGGVFRLFGQKHEKIPAASAGDVVAFGRISDTVAGSLINAGGITAIAEWPQPINPLYSLAIHADKRADEVKLSGALTKLCEEDPSLSSSNDIESGEMIFWGQGHAHLQIALDRLKNRYDMSVTAITPQVAYRETITKPVKHHARHKKQSGGHGQFGDVHLDIKPMPRGSGFSFDDTITGGAVPKQYISSVKAGVIDYLVRGPLGFPQVDVSVTLTDGQFHAVDSSDMAFRAAANLGMREAMPNCNPILLEPIFEVTISLPQVFISKVQRLVAGRRGHILGFDAKPGWQNWDEVKVHLPQSEMHDLINELRSMTMGVGTFNWQFDHLQELSGKIADQIVAARAKANS